MSIQELLPLLHQLSRADKLRVLQYVVNDLAAEEGIATPKQSDMGLSYGSGEAARQLQAMSDEAKEKGAGNPT